MSIADYPEIKQVTLTYITGYHQARGYAPSMREIQTHLGLGSVSTTRTLLHRMRKDGTINYTDGIARSVHTC